MSQSVCTTLLRRRTPSLAPRHHPDTEDRHYDYGPDDADDGHVAHTAILGNSDAIVTDDSRTGFKTSAILSEAAIDVFHPFEFAANTVAAHPEAGVRALVAMSQRMTTPAQSPREVLEELRTRYGMDEVVEILVPLLPAD